MLGGLRPYIPELKIADYRTYQGYCCGMCCQLRSTYGQASRSVLSHDIVVRALLTDSLAGRSGTPLFRTCPRHPFRRRQVLSRTKGILHETQIGIVIGYNHLLEERRETPMSRFDRWLFAETYAKAERDVARISRVFEQERDHLAALTEAGCMDYDTICQPMGNLYGALFAACAQDDPAQHKYLWDMGFALGKIYFFQYCVEHFDEANANGDHNVFVRNGLTRDEARESARSRCGIISAEVVRAYQRLDVVLNRNLLDNIFYLGLERCVEETGEPSYRKWEYDVQI